MAKNEHEVPQVTDFAYALGVDVVKLKYSTSAANSETFRVRDAAYRPDLVSNKEFVCPQGMDNIYIDPQLIRTIALPTGRFGRDHTIPPPADGTYRFPPAPGLRITRNTPIASMGSCFAREIKRKLLYFNFNYITEETHHPASVHASAAWERSYNTFSMRQILEYTFEDWSPGLRWWISPQTGRVQDPYRRIILYDSVEEAEADFKRHRKHSRRALQKAEVFIITLGLTEIWQDQKDGSVICLPSGPYVNEGGDMGCYRFRVSRYNENLENLERIHAIMANHNPDCKLLVTVSPVHLWATFREDLDVISASCNSKATLRAAADEFVARHDNVFYFPSFEMATIYTPITGKTWFTDGKENFHVNKLTVRFIMRQFFRIFAPDESLGN